jgi:N-6 DNA Methylase
VTGDLTTVRTVGGVLPPDLLARVLAGDGDLGGLSSPDYHLPSGESPREAANRAWSYLIGVWSAYQQALARLPDGDPAVGLTRERWLMVLLRELGYGRVPTTPAGGLHVGDRAYPVSHVWGRLPLHLLGWGVDLDRRTRGVPGAADRAPHAMVQELLNRTGDYLWAVVSNGRTMRLLRDSSALTGQSYVEFDLEAMFAGEVFSDFVVLFLLLHQSRVEVPDEEAPAADCWLERWRTAAVTSGTRALGLLRVGVRSAIEDLGTGFLQHPANTLLRKRLDAGTEEVGDLSLADYHAALLRLVYRLLFLFVAEDRDALLDPDADPIARQRYVDYYSTARLRRLARRRRGTRHGDLWQAERLVIGHLGREGGCPELALPGIGGLFDNPGEDVLADADLPNEALLAAVRSLSVVQPPGQPQRVVDYKNLGSEELGSIYESLLELVPRHDAGEQRFSLESLAGNDRKTTGSYYTPSSLIDLLLDETLDPLLDAAERAPDPEQALLSMTVCDPACGSGHFLVAAARRIAERLAIVRTGEVDPTPLHVQEATADVVSRCVYGVDLNPMAAELAKVSLWLESMQPGRPLSFLDAHVKVGNSLLGTTPALLRGGVPDEAFTVLEGDDRKATTALKKQNTAEKAKQDSLFDVDLPSVTNIDLRDKVRGVAVTGKASLAQVHEAQRRYAQYLVSPELARERLRADAWCAAFVQHKTPGGTAVTTATVEAAEAGTLDDATVREVQRLATQYAFFHWYLEFPDVFEVSDATAGEPSGWRGGFTAMVGNPPWERVKLQEQEFFAQRDAQVFEAANAAARKKLIKALTETNPVLADEWAGARRQAEATSHLLRKSGRYPLCGVGDVNTYSVFAELMRSSVSREGRMGIITPTGLATDATTAAFFSDTLRSKRLAAFYDFENEGKIFENVHHAFRFAVSCLTGGAPVEESRLAFLVRHVENAVSTRFDLAADEILMLNPNTGTLPLFRTRTDAEITLGIYRRHPVLMNDARRTNPWGLRFGTMFHMANDSGKFERAADLEARGATFNGWAYARGDERWLPLYEAKMLSHYDHRFSTYENATQAQLNVGALPRLTEKQHDDPLQESLPRYWVAESEVSAAIGERWDRGWFLGWRNITNAGNERTLVPSVFPRSGVNHAFPVALSSAAPHLPLVHVVVSSFVFDYITRQKLSGTNMTFGIVQQLAAPPPQRFREPLAGVAPSLDDWIRPRVVELTYTSHRIAPYAVDVLGLEPGADPGPPFRWLPERREQLRAELDAAMFHLYGLAADEVEHVLDSFFVVRKYEERDHGEFRTKRVILQIWHAMADAAANGDPEPSRPETMYTSPLTPPAGSGPRHPALPSPSP